MTATVFFSVILTLCLMCSCYGRPEHQTDSDEDFNTTTEIYTNTIKSKNVSNTKANIKLSGRLMVQSPDTLRGNEDSFIIFPDDSSKINVHNTRSSASVDNFKIKGKKHCIEGICEEFDDYPKDYIFNIVQENAMVKDFFNQPLVVDIGSRFKEDGETMCQTRTHTTYPKSAPNLNKTERIIVNVDGYQQALILETCMEDSKCKFSSMFPNDYESSCQQRYAIRRLMALNDDNKPAFDSFEVPSCCVCTFKRKS